MAGVRKRRVQNLENKDLRAEEALLREIFYDFYKYRGRIYRVNFVRGVFFGLGSLLGGTIVVALLIGLMTLFIQIPGGLGDFFRWIIDTIQKR
ncbi:DUF5665 domain-containing protein [Candidatus Saccharibacteria bacterium]|nr:DUF5665 domain-containing protein [Candidatus Saccharibacteria bacterium]